VGSISKVGFIPAFVNGVTMIIATEIGDKTFWLAALMAMRYTRAFVFLGSIGALVVMTILSVGLGLVVPALVPKQYTHYAAGALFAYFGGRLLREAATMDPGQGNEELAEAEEALADKGLVGRDEKEDERSGKGMASAVAPRLDDGKKGGSGAPWAAVSARDWPILTQAFTITFLAEWGDRSQIATIAMAAAQDPVGICLGAVIGHSLCTGLAVLGGRLLAARISERMVAYVGGALFLLFSIHSFVVGPEGDE
jgi:putative Ca2+/H+ antiporter (TMEM165/GDT1 family)